MYSKVNMWSLTVYRKKIISHLQQPKDSWSDAEIPDMATEAAFDASLTYV